MQGRRPLSSFWSLRVFQNLRSPIEFWDVELSADVPLSLESLVSRGLGKPEILGDNLSMVARSVPEHLILKQ